MIPRRGPACTAAKRRNNGAADRLMRLQPDDVHFGASIDSFGLRRSQLYAQHNGEYYK
jgi:hypothetical protein